MPATDPDPAGMTKRTDSVESGPLLSISAKTAPSHPSRPLRGGLEDPNSVTGFVSAARSSFVTIAAITVETIFETMMVEGAISSPPFLGTAQRWSFKFSSWRRRGER